MNDELPFRIRWSDGREDTVGDVDHYVKHFEVNLRPFEGLDMTVSSDQFVQDVKLVTAGSELHTLKRLRSYVNDNVFKGPRLRFWRPSL